MKEKPLHEKIIDLASLLMALIYVGGGIYLIFSSSSFNFYQSVKFRSMPWLAHLFYTGFSELIAYGKGKIIV